LGNSFLDKYIYQEVAATERPLIPVEIIQMPSMSNSSVAYFAPLVFSDEEVWENRKRLDIDIAELESACADVGLKRGLHYSMLPLSKPDLSEILRQIETLPQRIPMIEIKFRSKKYLQLATSSGIANDARGDETERAIWGPSTG
jgi:hypothetical protein